MRKYTFGLFGLSFVWLSLFPSLLQGQDKSVQLPDVSISARRKASTPALDSLNRLSPTLQLQQGLPISGMLLRSYGASGSGSVVFRGTQSAHTQILWNELSLQNPFLAQADASLLSGILLSGAGLQTGGSSLLASGGNFGGTLLLATESSPQEPRLRLGSQYDQTGNWRSYGQLRWVEGNREFRLRTWMDHDQNRFTVAGSPWRRVQEHSQRRFGGVEGGFRHQIREQTRMGLDFWWQKSERELGPGIWEQHSQARQQDEALRLSLHTLHQNRMGEWKASLGMNAEQLAYQDPLHHQFSDSRWITWVPALQWKQHQGNWHWDAGLRSEETQLLKAEGMAGMRENRTAAQLHGKYQMPSIPVSFQLSLRQEVWKTGGAALKSGNLLPSLQTEWTPGNHHLYAGMHRKQRFPSLNDRFWPGAGNPNLEAERGWNLEAGWKQTIRLGGVRIHPGLNVYQTHFEQSIQWTPQHNHWQAVNTGPIRIQGMEMSLQVETGTREKYLRLLMEGQWCRSHLMEERYTGDVSKGKQRMYIPEWQFQTGLYGAWKGFSARLQQAWTGSRNLNAEGSQQLPAVNLWDFRMGYKIHLPKLQKCQAFAEVRNLSNQHYQWLAGYPMPGRVFSMGLEWALL